MSAKSNNAHTPVAASSAKALAKATPEETINAMSFRDLMAAFEAITLEFDNPELDIEQAVSLHARGAKLLAALEARLDTAEHELTAAQA